MARKKSTEYASVRLVELKMVRSKTIRYEHTGDSAKNVVAAITPLFKDEYREKCVVVGMDSSNTFTVIHVVGVGDVVSAPVHIPNVIKPLLLSNSTACVLVHNHPGNQLEPSPSDRELTRRVQEVTRLLNIKLLDHIIVNSDCSEHHSMHRDSPWPY